MGKQLGKRLSKLVFALKQPLNRGRRILITGSSVAGCVLLLRSVGLLQSLELAALDQFFHLRPSESTQERILIVAIDEADIRKVGKWPIPDAVIAQLLQKLNSHKPRAIGLQIVRDLPVEPGHEQLIAAYKSMPNLIGIEELGNTKEANFLPPPVLSKHGQVGFSNLVLDVDGKVRRSLLYWRIDGIAHESFALKLAQLYLKPEGITLPPPPSDAEYLQLGKGVLRRFQPNDGGYVEVDAGGYQILSNFPKPSCHDPSLVSCGYRKVSLSDVLSGKVPPSMIRDRIILIGSTASSIQDFFLTPYSSSVIGTAQPMAGIELQAYFVSQLVEAALSGRPLLNVWSNLGESLWIFAWGYVGAVLSWRLRHPSHSTLSTLLACFVLTGSAYLAFINGWWIPLLPPLLTFCGSAVAINSHIAYMQEELKRSKEFLHEIINTIPDPIFVKNQKHQLIVLNDAYCQFIGYPKRALIEKSDYEFFPRDEADVFREQDELVFQTEEPHENEEKFTDATGNTHLIATKRSLHKDAAGNFFLVGVIRDITERKLIEEKLKRIATNLSRSNNELKLSENRFRYLAYHDPLTGLPNRKCFYEQVKESLEWARSKDLLLALLFIDLDGFKQVNDTLGHDNGDRLLQTVAHRLKGCLRGSDSVSRLGGDEFTVLLRAIPQVQVAATVAEKILTTIMEPIVLGGHTTFVGASIGISVYPLNSQESESLIKQADGAMYRAKQMGKNRYVFA